MHLHNFGGSMGVAPQHFVTWRASMWSVNAGITFGGCRPLKILEGKKTSKIRCDLRQLSSLTANTSRTHKDIDKRSMALSRAIHPALNIKNCELWSTNKKVIGVHVDPPYVDIARSTYTNAFEFGPRDFANGEISQPSNFSPNRT